MALISEQFTDVLDPRFRRIFNEEYAQVPDKLDRFYQMVGGTLQTERWSSVGTYGVIPQFTGTVKYNTVAQLPRIGKAIGSTHGWHRPSKLTFHTFPVNQLPIYN